MRFTAFRKCKNTKNIEEEVDVVSKKRAADREGGGPCRARREEEASSLARAPATQGSKVLGPVVRRPISA